MQTAERDGAQCERYPATQRTGRREVVALAVLATVILLLATALVAQCLSGAVTDLP